MDLVDTPNATAIAAFAAALEAAILDEGDATALLAAIAAKVLTLKTAAIFTKAVIANIALLTYQ